MGAIAIFGGCLEVQIHIVTLRLDKDLHFALHNETEPLLFLKQESLASNQFAGVHGPREFMEDRPLEIAKDLDCTKKVIQIVR
jgi:hypothetical protein